MIIKNAEIFILMSKGPIFVDCSPYGRAVDKSRPVIVKHAQTRPNQLQKRNFKLLVL